MGAILGIVFGIGLVFLLELRNQANKIGGL